LQAAAYSAFGATKPIYDPGGERIRWFCPRLISGQAVLVHVLNDLGAWEDRVSVSRLTARIVSAGELSQGSKDLLAQRGFKVEARIPLGGTRQLVMTYIGKCTAGRRSDADATRQEESLLDHILAQGRMSLSGLVADFDRLDTFRVEVVSPNSLSPEDIEHLVRLHMETFPTFPYDFRKKLEMMLGYSETYLMVIVRSLLTERIYAFSNLELNTLELDDGTHLSLAEYDNTMRVASDPDHGVVRGIGRILRLQLARLAASHGVDLCHSESRAGLAAINVNSYQVGMHFGGVLEKHLLISGRSDIDYKVPTRFETMNVWYLNREHLIAFEAKISAGLKKVGRK
jgi:hypothetical protein